MGRKPLKDERCLCLYDSRAQHFKNEWMNQHTHVILDAARLKTILKLIQLVVQEIIWKGFICIYFQPWSTDM